MTSLSEPPINSSRRLTDAGPSRFRDGGVRLAFIRWLVFAGLAAFVPLFYYLAVVGGFLPYGGILLIGVRNLFDPSLLLFSLVHLGVYGLLLYWISGLIARGLDKVPGAGAWLATAVVLVLLAGVGALPVFGIAHGQIRWASAYDIYASGKLR
jgi:hypothetical protein